MVESGMCHMLRVLHVKKFTLNLAGVWKASTLPLDHQVLHI